MDRRRLEEGLLLYWCLKWIREYNLKQLHEIPIQGDIDDLIQEVCPLYHEEYIKKWIGELSLYVFHSMIPERRKTGKGEIGICHSEWYGFEAVYWRIMFIK